MANTEDTTLDETLPYGTTAQDIENLVNAIKKKGGNPEAIKQIYGKPSNFDKTRKALESLKILDDGLNFSEQGRHFAYEEDTQQKKLILLQLLLSYPPYEYFLLYACQNDLSETNLDTIQNFWGRHNHGTSEYNRTDASTTFAHLLELAGLGKFTIGRRGSSSRIVWDSSANELIDKAHFSENNSNEKEEPRDSEVNYNSLSEESSQLALFENEDLSSYEEDLGELSDEDEQAIEDVGLYKDNPNQPNSNQESYAQVIANRQRDKILSNININPNININVDITSWESEKIVTFFKSLYGVFEDEN